ncbi:MAG: hypothetical protein Q8S73_20355 [Deltaproteobacteria bacterium]|nr:hypothetical protein [Myxococcales bacterium]MDP3216472.1 hypothetical protein [Deltaproteobacteria bacterium]
MNRHCPSCRQPLAPAATQSCPRCGEQLPSAVDAPPMEARLVPGAQTSRLAHVIAGSRRPRVPVKVQLAVDVDRTASSAPFRLGIHGNVTAILAAIEPRVGELTTWVFSHGDEDYGQRPVLHLSGGSSTEAVAAVTAIDFEGGGDPPEHHLDGVEFALKNLPIASDRQTRAALVCFCSSDTKPARTGRSARAIGEDLRRRGIITCIVAEPVAELRALCEAAEGEFITISATPTPTDMERVAGRVSASIMASLTAGGTLPMSAPPIPPR